MPGVKFDITLDQGHDLEKIKSAISEFDHVIKIQEEHFKNFVTVLVKGSESLPSVLNFEKNEIDEDELIRKQLSAIDKAVNKISDQQQKDPLKIKIDQFRDINLRVLGMKLLCFSLKNIDKNGRFGLAKEEILNLIEIGGSEFLKDFFVDVVKAMQENDKFKELVDQNLKSFLDELSPPVVTQVVAPEKPAKLVGFNVADANKTLGAVVQRRDQDAVKHNELINDDLKEVTIITNKHS